MDTLRADDMAYYRSLSPAERLLQALALMEDGIAMQRANFRRRYPGVSEEELELMLLDWLSRG